MIPNYGGYAGYGAIGQGGRAISPWQGPSQLGYGGGYGAPTPSAPHMSYGGPTQPAAPPPANYTGMPGGQNANYGQQYGQFLNNMGQPPQQMNYSSAPIANRPMTYRPIQFGQGGFQNYAMPAPPPPPPPIWQQRQQFPNYGDIAQQSQPQSFYGQNPTVAPGTYAGTTGTPRYGSYSRY